MGVSRVGCGVPPQRTFLSFEHQNSGGLPEKVRDGEDAIPASGTDALPRNRREEFALAEGDQF